MRRLILLLASVLLAVPASAAEISLSKDRRTITVSGWIEAGDSQRFLDVAAKAKPGATVRMSGNGGISGDAFKIGWAIRRHKLATDVRSGRQCLSACAFMWLGGAPRRMAKDAVIGFHAPYDPATGKTDPGRILHDRRYIIFMDATPKAADAMLVLDGGAPFILTPGEAKRLGVSVSVH